MALGLRVGLAPQPPATLPANARTRPANTRAQGFNLKSLKHLVLDEADKLLDMDFEQEIDQILKVRGGAVSVEKCVSRLRCGGSGGVVRAGLGASDVCGLVL